ncbi:MAG: hypothetical protein A2X08_14815 [Bacteroidetes bacterium GWA2_32_17]|nr:MAG: hypothetical protein A2X08_14815 [Bacteroidetes bacterium GWA2_32_17]
MLFVFIGCGESTPEAESTVNNSTLKEEVVKDYNYYLERIKNDEKWMIEVKKQAEEMGVSVDSALSKNAKYMAKQNGFVDETENEVQAQINIIKNNKEWYENVKAQAKERQISVDSMLIRSANYVISQREN